MQIGSVAEPRLHSSLQRESGTALLIWGTHAMLLSFRNMPSLS